MSEILLPDEVENIRRDYTSARPHASAVAQCWADVRGLLTTISARDEQIADLTAKLAAAMKALEKYGGCGEDCETREQTGSCDILCDLRAARNAREDIPLTAARLRAISEAVRAETEAEEKEKIAEAKTHHERGSKIGRQWCEEWAETARILKIRQRARRKAVREEVTDGR